MTSGKHRVNITNELKISLRVVQYNARGQRTLGCFKEVKYALIKLDKHVKHG